MPTLALTFTNTTTSVAALTAKNAALRARVAALDQQLDKTEKQRKLAWRKYYMLNRQLRRNHIRPEA